MRHMFTGVVAALLACGATAQSDVELKGDALLRFEKSKGAAFVGRDVKWDVPAKSLSVPKRTRNGYALFVQKGVGVLIEESSIGLEEVRRRGGVAVVRGSVEPTPKADRKPGEPAYVVVVRSISYKRRSGPKA